MAGTGFVCERWQQPFDDPSRNWWNSTQSSQEDAMNIFVAAIERVVVIFLKGKRREVLQTQGVVAHDDWIPGITVKGSTLRGTDVVVRMGTDVVVACGYKCSSPNRSSRHSGSCPFSTAETYTTARGTESASFRYL